MSRTLQLLTVVAVISLATCALAQAAPPSTAADLAKKDVLNTGDLDFSVPESPAFTALGVTPQTVTRPTNLRSLATSLLNGVDQNGNFQTGFALDTAPYMLYWGNKLTLRKYLASSWKRFVSRATVSIATTKGTTDADKSSRLATGLRLTIFDRGDPRADKEFVKEITTALNEVRDANKEVSPTASDDEKAKHVKDLQQALQKATKVIADQRTKKLKTLWNASSMVIGAAPSWISKDGNAQNLGDRKSVV